MRDSRTARLEVHMGPSTLGARDDIEAGIVQFIDKAKASLDIAVQEIESRPIAQALVRARQRGIRIRLVLEQDYLRETKPPADPFAIGGAVEENRNLLAALLRAGLDARPPYNPAILHPTFIHRHNRCTRPPLPPRPPH